VLFADWNRYYRDPQMRIPWETSDPDPRTQKTTWALNGISSAQHIPFGINICHIDGHVTWVPVSGLDRSVYYDAGLFHSFFWTP
jgi:prepilin-type processing-associated H-X9-DG protein